ncbi:Maf family protein [Plantactinospora sp. CA-290183]|uniref:Maf family protein n=1 Tax=Plantactinospora sp. CA-290183 TaxID=3240006 RepID=UPI003D906622
MRTTNRPRLVLASASPARRKLLLAAGIEPEVLVSGVDESQVDPSTPDALSLTLAQLKARAVAERLCRENGTTGQADRTAQQNAAGHEHGTDEGRTLVLGCDSVLAFDGEIYGKPSSAEDATERWRQMRGRSGVLHTGHCLIDLRADREVAEVAATTVHFATVTDEEIAAYVATGEPLQVAGAFTLDGIGGPFVDRVDGDPGTVIGLSLPLLRLMLNELDLRITDLWADLTSTAGSAPH